MAGASSPSTSSKSVMQTVNRSHRFVIQGYSLVKGMGVGKHIASDLFTVGGYHWAIYFYLDGFINLSEFAAFCRSDTIDSGDTELRDAFNLYDQDKNSLISATELYQVLNRIGTKCSVDECHNMIKSVDFDGDDNVNFSEFKRMMSNNRSNANSGE